MVTRLVGHKGIDLLCYIAERLIQRRIQLVIIGTGEEKYEWYLNTLRDRFGDKVSVNLLFDGGLANLVYAASDLYLMPSKSEPWRPVAAHCHAHGLRPGRQRNRRTQGYGLAV